MSVHDELMNLIFASEEAENIRSQAIHDEIYIEAASETIEDILRKRNKISPSELYYIIKIFPETVTESDVVDRFQADNASKYLRDFWTRAADEFTHAFCSSHHEPPFPEQPRERIANTVRASRLFQ